MTKTLHDHTNTLLEATQRLQELLEEGETTEAAIVAAEAKLDGIDPDGELLHLMPLRWQHEAGITDPEPLE